MRKYFVAYIMGGPQFTNELKLLDEEGADFVEIGIPFSDPVADGPTIKAAGEKAIEAGMTVEKILEQLTTHQDEIKTKTILMTYAHMIEAYGEEAFMQAVDAAGVYGLIIPDMPFEYAEQLKARYPQRRAKIISLIAMTAKTERLKQIAQQAEGFIYTVTMNETTGQNGQFHPELKTKIQHIQNETEIPVMAGFGIRTPEHVREISTVADGVIIGSEIVRRLEEQGIEGTRPFLKQVRQVLDETLS
ncbi:tryptophan synthase subunit alpha [Staphylococcus chromogenes]|uniref:tryptophan synthase subunit alpha n=1 Tax=Staphylococcus chromogenes TaxID=46126 RepID=UPI000D1C9D52|nr:tryptophan synthase subunit alpha [Staphylococcus chromogenes]PTF52282.1 tryptophan synthase subunit alpha [Staphylococcus chromogenes]